MKFALTSLLLLILGCQKSAPADTLSLEFKKSAKFAYALLQQSDRGEPVSNSDISRALAEVKAAASSSDEQATTSLLSTYRTNIEYTRMKLTPAELASTMASTKQTQCEIEKMLNEGLRGIEVMKACGEKLGL